MSIVLEVAEMLVLVGLIAVALYGLALLLVYLVNRFDR